MENSREKAARANESPLCPLPCFALTLRVPSSVSSSPSLRSFPCTCWEQSWCLLRPGFAALLRASGKILSLPRLSSCQVTVFNLSCSSELPPEVPSPQRLLQTLPSPRQSPPTSALSLLAPFHRPPPLILDCTNPFSIISCNPTTTPEGALVYRFRDDEMETQRGGIICPSSHSQEDIKPGSKRIALPRARPLSPRFSRSLRVTPLQANPSLSLCSATPSGLLRIRYSIYTPPPTLPPLPWLCLLCIYHFKRKFLKCFSLSIYLDRKKKKIFP